MEKGSGQESQKGIFILLVILVLLAGVAVIQAVEINGVISRSASGGFGNPASSSPQPAARQSSAPTMVGGC